MTKSRINPTPFRLAVVGIGNDLNGDDAAGMIVTRRLKDLIKDHPESEQGWLLVIDGSTAPENYAGVIRRFSPDYLLFIDAVDMGSAVGSIDLIEVEEMDGFGASTHIMPPSTLGEYIRRETGCEVVLLGIQAGTTDFGAPISPEVEHSCSIISTDLAGLLNGLFQK